MDARAIFSYVGFFLAALAAALALYALRLLGKLRRETRALHDAVWCANAPWRKNRQSNPAAILRRFHIFMPPVPIEQIVQSLGIQLHAVPDAQWVGAVEIADDGTAHIWVNASARIEQQTFATAHELGHLLLHPEPELRTGKRCGSPKFAGSYQEIRANRFAAYLLVPDWMLENLAPAAKYDPSPLARRFGVSESLIQIRLDQMARGDRAW